MYTNLKTRLRQWIRAVRLGAKASSEELPKVAKTLDDVKKQLSDFQSHSKVTQSKIEHAVSKAEQSKETVSNLARTNAFLTKELNAVKK